MLVSELIVLTSPLTNTSRSLLSLSKTRLSFQFHSLRSEMVPLASPAAAPLLKSAKSLSPDWLLALNTRQIIPLSWLQQTGNTPRQVTPQARPSVELVACGETWLITVASSSHLLPWRLFSSRSINAVWIKMLCPKQPPKAKVDPKLLICGF